MADQTLQPIKIGFCVGCDVQIFDKEGGRLKKNDLYSEHEVELSNGTLMPVGVCTGCKVVLSANSEDGRALAEIILERHKLLWDTLADSHAFKPTFHADLSVEDHNSSEEKIRSKMIVRANAEKAKQEETADNARRIRENQKK